MFLISLVYTLQVRPSKMEFFVGMAKSAKKNDKIKRKNIDPEDFSV